MGGAPWSHASCRQRPSQSHRAKAGALQNDYCPEERDGNHSVCRRAPPLLGAFPAARLYPHACQMWEMPVMGFKIQDMLSMYEFEAGSKKPSRHFTAIDQAPRQNGQHMVIDLWDIRGALKGTKRLWKKIPNCFPEYAPRKCSSPCT